MSRHKPHKQVTDPFVCNINLSFIVNAGCKEAAESHVKCLARALGYYNYNSQNALRGFGRSIKTRTHVANLDYPTRYNTYYQAKRNQQRAMNNIPMFIEQAHTWNAWDYSFTIDLLSKLLKLHAKDLKEDRWHLHAIKRYRHCLYAANQLTRLYEDYSYTNDIAYKYYDTKIKRSRRRNKDGGETWTAETTPTIEKLLKISMKRMEQWDKQRKQDLWQFINKHIEQWWS